MRIPRLLFNTEGGGGGGIVPPVNTPPADDGNRVPPARRGGVECGFCECHVAPDGGVVRTSERARKLAKIEDIVAAQKDEITRLERELAEERRKAAAAQPEKKRFPKFTV